MTETIRLDPRDRHSFFVRGSAWGRKGDWDKCIADYSSAIRIDPTYCDALSNRGVAWATKENWAQALADHSRALELNPNCALALYNRALLWAGCPDGKYRDGKRALKDALRLCELRKCAEALFVLAVAYAEVGQFAEAVKWQKKALEDEQLRRAMGNRGERTLKLFEGNKPFRMELAD